MRFDKVGICAHMRRRGKSASEFVKLMKWVFPVAKGILPIDGGECGECFVGTVKEWGQEVEDRH